MVGSWETIMKLREIYNLAWFLYLGNQQYLDISTEPDYIDNNKIENPFQKTDSKCLK